MTPANLKRARKERGWTQSHLASRLGVSQAYVNQLERGKRKVTRRLGTNLARTFSAPAALPLDRAFRPAKDVPASRLTAALANLGYPGFAYLGKRGSEKHPGEVLLTALAQDGLDPRVLEGLPWLLLRYWEMDFDWLLENARRLNLQNRLGFIVNLARQLSQQNRQDTTRTTALQSLESVLDESRLAREDFLGPRQTNTERQWLKRHRSSAARRWNLLTDLQPRQLRYDAA